MKKALALVLALVLALSMAVSAFAIDLVVLEKDPVSTYIPTITVVDAKNNDEGLVVYAAQKGAYYIALDTAKVYKNIVLSANGVLSAEMVEYNPEKMNVAGLEITYSVTEKGKAFGLDATDAKDVLALAMADGDAVVLNFGMIKIDLGEEATFEAFEKAVLAGKTLKEAANACINVVNENGEAVATNFDVTAEITVGKTYADAKALAAALNDVYEVTYYGIKCDQNVNIIKLVIEDNYSVAYALGTLKINADLVEGKKVTPVAATLKVVNDVTIFEYEQVKWAAENNLYGAALYVGEKGYSDWATANDGYGKDYNVEALRSKDDAAVVSTTAFRAIAGEDLTIVAGEHVVVDLLDIVAGQKGVNFKNYYKEVFNDVDKDFIRDAREELTSIDFGFYGDQVVKGDYEITVTLPYDYYDLREEFGLKVEEDDIITYYILKDGKVCGDFTVDYMTDKLTEEVELVIKGSNSALGEYSLVLEVPAAEVETETEANPNTGAESVVGVVAALAVVSLASAAAVSLKK